MDHDSSPAMVSLGDQEDLLNVGSTRVVWEPVRHLPIEVAGNLCTMSIRRVIASSALVITGRQQRAARMSRATRTKPPFGQGLQLVVDRTRLQAGPLVGIPLSQLAKNFVPVKQSLVSEPRRHAVSLTLKSRANTEAGERSVARAPARAVL